MTIQLLTEAEAADRLLARPQSLRKWRARRKGPPYLKLAGKIRYRLDDIEKFIEGSRIVPGETKRRPRRRRKGTAIH